MRTLRTVVAVAILAVAACGGQAASNTGDDALGDSGVDVAGLERQINLDLHECALDNGLPAELIDGGVFVPDGVRDAGDILLHCEDEVLANPVYEPLVDPTPGVQRVHYDRLIELFDCMLDTGLEPTVDPPDFASWQHATDPWHPLEEFITGGGHGGLLAVQQQCSI